MRLKMKKFDYSFLKDEVPSNILNISEIIADLRAKEEFRRLQYSDTFEKLSKIAVVESVKGSNAIEGIVTTDDRIRDIVNGAAPITHAENEISGYKDALNLIHINYKNMDIDEALILSLHKMIQNETNPSEAGKFKSHDNLIMEYLSNGDRRVRFKPTKAVDTTKAIKQMLYAYYDARQDSNISKLLLIPCFIVDFLCIHPFLDGNGRVSRLLTVLLLYMSGYDVGKYISFEAQINKYKDNYYDALEKSSIGWHENKNDYIPFAIYFMQILYRCYKELDDSFMDISLKKAKKSERVEAILRNSVVPVSKAEIIAKIPDVSERTVEVVLGRMVKDNKVIKIGTFKDARYMCNMH